MKQAALLLLLIASLTVGAADFDEGKPFGFCTRSSRTDAASTYEIDGFDIFNLHCLLI